MICRSALFFLIFSIFQAFADETPVNTLIVKKQPIINAHDLSTLSRTAVVNGTRYQAFVNNIKSSSLASSNAPTSSRPEVLILVSLNMPELTLGQTLQQAEHYHVSVAIRGLIHDSFQETVGKIFELSKKYHVKGVQINPLWFRAFQVEKVPAFIATTPNLVCKNDHCDSTQFDVIYGNISVEEALKRIVQVNGVGASVAFSYLRRASHG